MALIFVLKLFFINILFYLSYLYFLYAKNKYFKNVKKYLFGGV